MDLRYDLRHFILFIICILFSLSCSQKSFAYAFEDSRPLYAGCRQLAMGNAYIAGADDAGAGCWNPAGLIQWQGVKVAVSTQLSDRDRYAFDSKCIGYCYRNTAFFWGNKIALRVRDDTPDFSYYSLAHKLNSHIAIGGSAKFKRRHPSDYYQFFGYSTDYDLGMLWKPNVRNSAGIVIQSLSGSRRWVDAVVLGIARQMPGKLLLSADIATVINDNIRLEPYIGCEWQANKWILARCGLSNGRPAFGIGAKIAMLKIDYAIIHDKEGNISYLSCQLKL